MLLKWQNFILWPSSILSCVCVCVYHIFFIYSSVDRHLGCFHTLTILNNAVMNIGVYISFWISVLGFFGCIPRSGIAGHMVILILIFWKNLYTVFDSGYTNLHSHQQCRRVPFYPHSQQHLLSVFFLMIPILIGKRQHLIVVWICISLMISHVEHLFMCLSAIYIYFLEKNLFSFLSIP